MPELLAPLTIPQIVENFGFLKKFPESKRGQLKNFLVAMLDELYKAKLNEWEMEPLMLGNLIFNFSDIALKKPLAPTALKEIWLKANLDDKQLLFLLKKFHHVLVEHEKLNMDISISKMFVEKEINDLERKLRIGKITWRIKAIAHNYLVQGGLSKQLTRSEMREQGGKRFEQAFDSLNVKAKGKFNPYTAPTLRELERVIELLADFPEVKKAAINDLSFIK